MQETNSVAIFAHYPAHYERQDASKNKYRIPKPRMCFVLIALVAAAAAKTVESEIKYYLPVSLYIAAAAAGD